jgi:hypothetical protein
MKPKPTIARIVWIAASLLLIAACGMWYGPFERDVVRATNVVQRGSAELPGPDGVFVFENHDKFRLKGRGVTAVEPPVDFARENLVRIWWHADGPLFGTLKHRVRLGGGAVVFHVDAPTADYRTFSRIVSEEWFIVPKGTSVIFAPPVRIWFLDGVPLVLLALLLVIGFKICGFISDVRRILQRGQRCVQAG